MNHRLPVTVRNMAVNRRTLVLTGLFLSVFLLAPCESSSCSTENECLHFEYCCKGNCTSKRLKCEHVCEHDTQCQSGSVCVLGLCFNCTVEFPCTKKACFNDTHCPSGHSCEEKVCKVHEATDLTIEMVPFIIFITALTISLLIVCYNDYFLERLGRRGLRDCITSSDCNCRLTLWFWMWRMRRSRERDNDNHASCPAIQVQFDSRVRDPSNTLNEKTQSLGNWSFLSLSRRLLFWRRRSEDFLREPLPSNETSEETDCNLNPNSVFLLNEFTNANECSGPTRSCSRPPRNTTCSQTESKTTTICTCSIVNSPVCEAHNITSQPGGQQENIQPAIPHIPGNGHRQTLSHSVTIV